MSDPLHLDVYGRRMIAEKRDGRWDVMLAGAEGKRRSIPDLRIPSDVSSEEELIAFLRDIYHESGRPGHGTVSRVDGS